MKRLFITLLIVFLQIGCASKNKCEKHGEPLTLVRGYVRNPLKYQVIPPPVYWELLEQNPHMDRGLIDERKEKPSGKFNSLSQMLICPKCVANQIEGNRRGLRKE